MGRIKASKEDLARNVLFTPGLWYKMKITKYEEKASKSKDNPSTNHIFTFVNQPQGNPETDAFVGAGFPVFFNEQAIGAIGPLFAALGAEKDAEGGYDVDPNACVGKEVEVFVKHREDDKKRVFNEAAEYRPVGTKS